MIKKFEFILKNNNLDGFIVTNPTNIFFLCGFRGISPTERESILVFSKKGPVLIAPRLYQAEAKKLESPILNVEIVKERDEIKTLCQKLIKNAKRVGFEEEDLKYSEFLEFKKNLPGVRLIPFKNLIENMRLLKTPEEIKKIKTAQIISQKAFDELLKTLKVGQTEAEIADTLAKILKSKGAKGLAFESIIASGPNSAKPHHVTGNRRLKVNDTLLLDFGAKYQNYCGDLSRTVFIKKAKDEHKKVYHHVKRAQENAISKIKKAKKASEIYAHAFDVFQKENLSENFLHGLGHGIGLEVHERPYLRPTIDDKLEEGMVFSVEPGLYLPWGGVRIEDLVAIEKGRARLLGKTSEFIEI